MQVYHALNKKPRSTAAPERNFALGHPICPGIISFVEKGGEKEMGNGRGMDRTPCIVATGSCKHLKE